MDLTLLFFTALYMWGFTLTLWAIFIDKHPTKLSRNSSVFALIVLILSLIYFFFKWIYS